MEIKIVNAKPEDYDNFIVVFKEIEEYHRINVPWKFIKPTPELFAEKHFQEIINNDNGVFFLAKDKDKVIGYIIAIKANSPNLPMLKPRKWVQIDDLSVRSDYRKNGVGELLMNKVETWAKKNKIHSIELNVWCFNKGAIKFYEKRGYDAFNQKMRKELT